MEQKNLVNNFNVLSLKDFIEKNKDYRILYFRILTTKKEGNKKLYLISFKKDKYYLDTNFFDEFISFSNFEFGKTLMIIVPFNEQFNLYEKKSEQPYSINNKPISFSNFISSLTPLAIFYVVDEREVNTKFGKRKLFTIRFSDMKEDFYKDVWGGIFFERVVLNGYKKGDGWTTYSKRFENKIIVSITDIKWKSPYAR